MFHILDTLTTRQISIEIPMNGYPEIRCKIIENKYAYGSEIIN